MLVVMFYTTAEREQILRNVNKSYKEHSMKKLLLRSRIVIGVSLTASVAALLAVCVLLYFILQMTTATDVSGVVKKCLPTSVMILTEKTIGTEDSGEIVQEAATGIIWEQETDTIYISRIRNQHFRVEFISILSAIHCTYNSAAYIDAFSECISDQDRRLSHFRLL